METTNRPSASSTSTGNLPAYLPAVAADVIGVILLAVLFAPLRALFEQRTIRGGMLFLVVYIAFALGVNALKRLEGQNGRAASFVKTFDYTRSAWVAGVLAILVIAGFLVVQIDLNQATESMIALMSRPESFGHEGEITLYYSFGPLFLWLMIGVLYLAAMVLPTQRLISAGTTRYQGVEFISLLTINVMLILSSAYLAVALPRLSLLSGRPLLIGISALLLLEIVFDPPRLRHALKQPLWLPLATFFTLILSAAALIFISI